MQLATFAVLLSLPSFKNLLGNHNYMLITFKSNILSITAIFHILFFKSRVWTTTLAFLQSEQNDLGKGTHIVAYHVAFDLKRWSKNSGQELNSSTFPDPCQICFCLSFIWIVPMEIESTHDSNFFFTQFIPNLGKGYFDIL